MRESGILALAICPCNWFCAPTLPCVHKRRKVVGKFIVGSEYREYLCIGTVEKLDGMGKVQYFPFS